MKTSKLPGGSNKGFTLIELLVVVAIIALLMAMMLPSLSSARRIAKTAKCLANLHGIASAQLTYASEWSDAIPGSASTSCLAFFSNPATDTHNPNFGTLNPPPAVQVFDWVSPLMPSLGINIQFTTAVSTPNRVAMFEAERRAKILTCPANDFQAAPYGSPACTVGPLLSYNMAMLFLFTSGYKQDGVVNGDYVPMQNGYSPKVARVGNPASKIMVADGARYSSSSNQPDCDLNPYGTQGGSYADWGAFDSYSKSWDRGMAPNNGNPNGGSFDGRFYSFRHSQSVTGGAAGTFKMNAAFFDGHAETLDDLAAANPALWCPAGESIPSTEASKDVIKKYFNGNNFVAP